MLGTSTLGQITLASLAASGASLNFVECSASVEASLTMSLSLTLSTLPQDVGASTYPTQVDLPSNLFVAANNVRTTLASALTISGTSLTLTDASRFPGSGAITLDLATISARTLTSSEIIYFNSKSGNVLTIQERGADGTTAKAWEAGMSAEMRSTAHHHNLLASTIIAIETEVDTKADSGHVHDDNLSLSGGTLTGPLVLSGPPAIPLHAVTKAYVDGTSSGDSFLGWFNVKAYGLVGNGTTDDTVAFQNLINLVVTAGGGRIYFPRGTYLIAGPLQDTGGGNAQILLPVRNDADPPLVLEFIGETTPPTWLWEGGPPTGAGFSVIKSTLTGGSGTAALIGGARHPLSELSNMIMPNFRDLIFETPPNPSFTVLNLIEQTGNRIERVLIHDGSITESQDEPTNANAYGVKLPPTNHSSRIWLDNLHVVGFYTGVKFGELTQGSFIAQGCKRAVELPFAHHPCTMEFLGIYGCQYGIYATDAGERAMYVELLSLQDDTGYAQPWQSPIADIYDPSNLIRGRFNWYNVRAGIGIQHSIIKDGGINFIGTEMW